MQDLLFDSKDCATSHHCCMLHCWPAPLMRRYSTRRAGCYLLRHDAVPFATQGATSPFDSSLRWLPLRCVVTRLAALVAAPVSRHSGMSLYSCHSGATLMGWLIVVCPFVPLVGIMLDATIVHCANARHTDNHCTSNPCCADACCANAPWLL